MILIGVGLDGRSQCSGSFAVVCFSIVRTTWCLSSLTSGDDASVDFVHGQRSYREIRGLHSMHQRIGVTAHVYLGVVDSAIEILGYLDLKLCSVITKSLKIVFIQK